jgi:outer membrane protein TolC
VPEATAIEASLDAAQAQALSARPELAEARLAVQQAELNRRITKTQYIPDVSLAVNNLSLTNINLLPSYVATAGVLVSWDPIDWGRRKHELATASKSPCLPEASSSCKMFKCE